MNSKTARGIKLIAIGALVMVSRSQSPAEGLNNDQDHRQALIKKGDYLVNDVARCEDCHTPRDERGRLDKSRLLQGAKMWFRPAVRVGEFEDKAPDITLTGKAGKWTEEKMIKLLTSGHSDFPMPSYKLTEEDARAVTAYLRSLKGGGRHIEDKRGERGKEKDDD